MKLHAHRTFSTTAPPEAVFTFMADFRTTEAWDPGTLECTLLSDHVGPGARYCNKSRFLGRETELEYQTLEYDPVAHLHFEGRNGSFVGDDRLSFFPDGTGTIVDYDATFELHGASSLATPLVAAYMPVLATRTADRLQETLDSL